ncbi:hypothetical protein ACFWMT_22895, partial [Streptomyces sp. NPDC058368]
GRAWRRRAPVESLMPLRLAKYGVPLAETGPAGLATAGIEPAVLPAQTFHRAAEDGPVNDSDRVPVATTAVAGVRPVDSHGAEPWQIEADEPNATDEQSVDVGEQGRQKSDVVLLPEIDYQDAVRGYLFQFGRLPDAGQFSSFLAHHGVVDPVTGDPLPGTLLGPVLEDVQNHMQAVPEHEHEGVEDCAAAPSGGEHHDVDENPLGAAAGHTAAAAVPDKEPEPDKFVEGNALFEEDGPRSHTGTAADRTGGTTRITAQARIPAPAESPEQKRDVLPEPETGEPGEADEFDFDDEAAEEPTVPLIGPALVEHHYRALQPEERQRSANALAPALAEKTGYAVGTVRKYIGQIKRSDAAAIPSTVQG